VGSHAAAETGADYDEVEIESSFLPADVDGACGVGFTFSVP